MKNDTNTLYSASRADRIARGNRQSSYAGAAMSEADSRAIYASALRAMRAGTKKPSTEMIEGAAVSTQVRNTIRAGKLKI